jgi:RimJ/RimL family protein N-acetyltransferase
MTGAHLGPTLETERLILRPPQQSDFEAWAKFSADAVVMATLGGVQTEATAWRTLAGMAGSWALLGFGMFSVLEKASGRWVGRLGPWCPAGWPGTEVGWGLTRDAWGRGYATEGATAAMDFAVDQLGWSDIVHCIAPDNVPSQAVAARLGSTLRGPGKLPAPLDTFAIEL